MSAPLLANALGGSIFFAFISAIAFATILAVVAGLTITASTSFAHDVWTNIIRHGQEHNPGEERRVARIAAFVVGAISIAIAIVLGPTANVAFLVALAFAVAASANLPVILFSIFWRRFNTTGAVMGLVAGLLASIVLIFIGPSIMTVDAPTVAPAARHMIQHAPIFPLENPGMLSIPIGFIGAILGTLLSRKIRRTASPRQHGPGCRKSRRPLVGRIFPRPSQISKSRWPQQTPAETQNHVVDLYCRYSSAKRVSSTRPSARALKYWIGTKTRSPSRRTGMLT
jgi:Na+(H+)/acetate symporter ActP